MNLSGFEVYRYYLAVKTHFTKEGFDVFEHRGSKCSLESYEERREKKLFELLGSKYEDPQELIYYMVSNIAIGFDDFLYDREKALENHQRWLTYKSGSLHRFQMDCSTIELYMGRFDKSFAESAWKCYLNKSVHIQTIHILNELNNIFNDLNESTRLMHKEDILRIKKCKGFVKITDKIRNYFSTNMEYICN